MILSSCKLNRCKVCHLGRLCLGRLCLGRLCLGRLCLCSCCFRDLVQASPIPRPSVPMDDQRTALALYCELGVQRGSITDVLDIALLLWNLWHSAKSDNRCKGLSGAPLIPLVDRFEVSCCNGIVGRLELSGTRHLKRNVL